jgi:uncharacterized membrane protein YozB (DUF420 family)
MLILLSIVPVAAGVARLLELAGGGTVSEGNARFFASPLPVVMHILAVIPYSILGALQFAPAVRCRWPTWHRMAGRYLAVLGLVAALTGLWMARFYPWPTGDGELLFQLRCAFGSAMIVSILLGIEAVRRRDFVSHGAWMLRGYAIAMGAGTQVLTHLPWLVVGVQPGEMSRATAMGAGWVINLVVAEWVIRRGGSRGVVVQRVARA